MFLECPDEILLRSTLSDRLEDSVKLLERLLNEGVNSDARFRMVNCAGTMLCVVCIEGMADAGKISDFVLRPCVEHQGANASAMDADYLIENVLQIPQCEAEQRVRQVVDALVTGLTNSAHVSWSSVRLWTSSFL